MVFWLTGLTGSGKSSLAEALHKKIGATSVVIDADQVRRGLNSDLGFCVEDRAENVRRMAHLAKREADQGKTVIAASISPLKKYRDNARSIIGDDRFIEVFVDAPLSVCRTRDFKNIYKAFDKGELKLISGLDFPYEIPEKPQIHLKSDTLSLQEEVEQCLIFLKNLN